jgi:uncharacterized membrane protein
MRRRPLRVLSLIPAHLRRRFGAERGAVMLLTGVAMVGVIASTAIAVDIGHAVEFKKDLQGDADLAALDAVRALSDRKGEGGLAPQVHAQKLAKESLLRNGFDANDSGNIWTVVLGNINSATRVFVPAANLATANAVKVTLTGPIDWSFQPGGRTYSVEGIAEAPSGVSESAVAGIALGSWVANLDTSKSAILNSVLGGFLGGGLNLSLVSYQGLAAGEVTLRGLATALDLGVGTPDEVLSTNITMLQLLQAAAEVMTTDGNVAALQAGMGGLITAATALNSNLQFQLSDLITVAQGGGSAALDTALNIFTLVSGAAQVADGDHFINIPMLGVSIPGLSSLNLKLQVIEAPQIAIGPAKIAADGKGVTRVKTAQVRAQLDLNLINLSLLGITARLRLPIYIEAGSAEADLRSMSCGPLDSQQTASVGVRSQALHARVADVGETDMKDISTSVSETSPVNILNLIGVVRVNASSVPYNSTQTTGTLNFVGPYPKTQSNGGSTTLGLSTLLQNGLALSTDVLGLGFLINPLLGGLTSTITSTLSGVFGALDSALLNPLLSALGLSLGGADVQVFHHQCTSRWLAK